MQPLVPINCRSLTMDNRIACSHVSCLRTSADQNETCGPRSSRWNAPSYLMVVNGFLLQIVERGLKRSSFHWNQILNDNITCVYDTTNERKTLHNLTYTVCFKRGCWKRGYSLKDWDKVQAVTNHHESHEKKLDLRCRQAAYPAFAKAPFLQASSNSSKMATRSDWVALRDEQLHGHSAFSTKMQETPRNVRIPKDSRIGSSAFRLIRITSSAGTFCSAIFGWLIGGISN